MKSTVNISLRIPTEQARILKRAARVRGLALATFVREAAFDVAAEIVVRDAQPKDAAQQVAS